MFFSSASIDAAIAFSSSHKTFFNSVNRSLVSCDCKYLSNLLIDTSVCSIISNFAVFKIFFELPHLQLFFGFNVVQTVSTLIINKADLGLTPSANNTAESILVGILNKILGNKQGVQFMKINFTYWGYGVFNGKRVDTIIINLYDALSIQNTYEISDITTIINPNKY